MNEEKIQLNPEELERVSGGTDFDENDRCPKCGSKNIDLILYARAHLCLDCGHSYD